MATACAAQSRRKEFVMPIHHTKMPASIWVVFYIGVLASIVYSTAIFFLTIFPYWFGASIRAHITEWWGIAGGVFICLQIIPVVSRPVHKDAWEIADHLTSWISIVILLGAFPAIWFTRGIMPDRWTWQVYGTALALSVADVLLTFVSLKISRFAQRITPA